MLFYFPPHQSVSQLGGCALFGSSENWHVYVVVRVQHESCQDASISLLVGSDLTCS